MTADSRGGLAGRTARGFLWALLAAGGSKVLSVAALAVVARILAPEQFGLFAFALVYVMYLNVLGDLGVGTALIYWKERVDDAAQLTFLVNLATGVLWCLLTLAVAPVVAGFFHSPEGTPILRALSLIFLVRGLGNTHDALCRKELQFRERVLPELGLALTKGVLIVVLALAGMGVWSLVWGQLAGEIVWAAALWRVVPWRPSREWPSNLFRSMLAYGKGIVAVNVIAAVVHHADYVVVGRMLGMEELGYYQLAYKIPEMAVLLVLWQVNTVLFPAFSKVSEASDMAGAYVEAMRYITLLVLPAATGLFFLAEPIVLTLFGGQWGPAVPILRVLAVYVAFRALGSHAGDVMKAAGRPGLLAGIGLAKAVVLVPALVVAARFSTPAVGGAMAGVAALALPVQYLVVRSLTGARIRDMLASLRDGILATGILAGFLVGWTRLIPDSRGVGVVFGGVVLGAGLYLGAVRLVAPSTFRRALARLR